MQRSEMYGNFLGTGNVLRSVCLHRCPRQRFYLFTHRSHRQCCRASNSQGAKSSKPRARTFMRSDGTEHLGSAVSPFRHKQFPGPPPGEGPPLRVLPIGGLGEIGMNCMLVGVYDRYILVDAGLMFPDQQDLGMQKILPDSTFLAKWKDKIEALVITHGHEDHIGALPWVFPALDRSTPVYAGGYPMQLIQRRMQEYSMWDPSRFHTFKMNDRFQLGPFECQPLRVTHSIPDSCGLILRSEHGTIVHTGDWKIDESPVDGEVFDRSAFEAIGSDGATLLMSDSTNVLSPGRTLSEASVHKALAARVAGHHGKGRVLVTQFASNLHRLAGVKKAADAAGRKMCFMGLSLHSYLEAAHREGRAPFNPDDIVPISDIGDINPNELLIVTTGSQAEPRAQLALAAKQSSQNLRLLRSDLVLYAARVIPGNDTRVTQMMNEISQQGPEIAMGRGEALHTSGHAYRDELEEVLKLVRPQHFLPVHGEYSYLCAHAELARNAGIRNTNVIRNGQMLGCAPLRNGKALGGLQLLGNTSLRLLYNDGNNGTGTADEMSLDDRRNIAAEGIVIAAVEVFRPAVPSRSSGSPSTSGQHSSMADDGSPDSAAVQANRLQGRVRVTTRAMWVDKGKLLQALHQAANTAVARLPWDATLLAVERLVAQSLRRECRAFNQRRPEVIVIAHEHDATSPSAAAAHNDNPTGQPDGNVSSRKQSQKASTGKGSRPQPGQSSKPAPNKRRRAASSKSDIQAPPARELTPEEVQALRSANPREAATQETAAGLEYA